MIRTRTALVALTALALTVSACAGDSTGGLDGSTGPDAPTPASPVGTYALKTVDGKPLPAPMGSPVKDRDFTIVARALNGQFTFYADGTYRFTASAEIVATGIEYRQAYDIVRTGTYTADSTTITLGGSGGAGTMTRAGMTLTSSVTVPAASGGNETVVMVFSR